MATTAVRGFLVSTGQKVNSALLQTTGGPIIRHVVRRSAGLIKKAVIVVAALCATYLVLLFPLASLQLQNRISIPIVPDAVWEAILFPADAAAGLLTDSTLATRLYVASYAGTVTTLDLVGLNRGATGLRTIASTTACGINPSWLVLDYAVGPFLYCLDEAWGRTTGSVTSFGVSNNGTLTARASAEVIPGPVSIAGLRAGRTGLAIASYAGSGVSVVALRSNGIELVQNETYTLDQPGPIPDRQEAPHPHQAILDPTASYILVPDLGADLVRVYLTGSDPMRPALTSVAPLKIAPGAGPRHCAFKTANDTTYLYVVTELANTIIGYDVRYNTDKTLDFSELFTIPVHGDNRTLAATAASSEILVTPDKRFLIVSSRWENSLRIPNFDKNNDTEILSDPLIVYAIDDETGSLEKIQEFAAGGSGPRHFSLNHDGTLLAVGLQGDGRVVVIKRDVQTGLLKDFIAATDVAGEVNSVVFYEEYVVLTRNDVAYDCSLEDAACGSLKM